ncbi:MAG: phage tail tape measure protein [Spirochaetes bacterium]|nr:phage tail tape measure protein [Spirochaetota bacterium]
MALFGDQSLQIVINAKDNASKVFKKFEKNNKETIKNLKKLGVAGSAAVATIGVASVKMAADFDKSMSNVSTLIDTNVESMDDMKEAVLDLSKRTPVALGDLSSALYDVRSAGISAGSAMEVLENSAKLGVAGLGTTKEAANLLTTAINAFGLQGRDSAEVADVLFKTVKAGKTDIANLSQAFGKMAGNAKAAGVEFEDVQAATAALTALTGKTSEAQNALAQAFLELTVQGGKLDKGLQENGSSLDELNEMIGEQGLVGGMKMMQEELGLTETEFKNLFSSAEAGTSIYQLLTDAYDGNMEALYNMKNGANEMDEATRKQNAAASAQYQILKNQLNVELIKLGSKILPVLLESIPAMTNMWLDAKYTFDAVTESLSELIFKAMQAYEWVKKVASQASIGGIGASIGGGIQSGMSAIGLPTFNDFISRPGSAPVSFSPDDTIIGVKKPGDLGGQNINVSFNNLSVRDDGDVDRIRDMMDDYFRTVMVNNKITA